MIMDLSQRLRQLLGRRKTGFSDLPADGSHHLNLAKQSLRDLLDDPHIPHLVRQALQHDYQELQTLLGKLDAGHIHIAVCGRVGVGKSALLNALLGQECFSVSPLHGETKKPGEAPWAVANLGEGLFLIDTPGLDEVDGEARETMTRRVVHGSDLTLFVTEGDLTHSEFQAFRELISQVHKPLILILNKADRFTLEERELLLATLRQRTAGLLPADRLLACAAKPRSRIHLETLPDGSEREISRPSPPEVENLRQLLTTILLAEGKTLAAVNAGLAAGRFSDQLSVELTSLFHDAAERVIRAYCIGKGVAVAINPLPLVDILAMAADGAMVMNLAQVYHMRIDAHEAGHLLRTIAGQMLFLMGTVYGTHLLSSAFKSVSAGLSTFLTAGAQGAVAYYGTYAIGRAAERYFAQGKSWGPGGPKQAVREILDSLDRQSILSQARDDILARLRPGNKS
ncbi:MAG: GTP-binding protein [Magnetococcales bacterium]|nr:GTP-binding protein [Magnetococcales bacterium]